MLQKQMYATRCANPGSDEGDEGDGAVPLPRGIGEGFSEELALHPDIAQ